MIPDIDETTERLVVKYMGLIKSGMLDPSRECPTKLDPSVFRQAVERVRARQVIATDRPPSLDENLECWKCSTSLTDNGFCNSCGVQRV